MDTHVRQGFPRRTVRVVAVTAAVSALACAMIWWVVTVSSLVALGASVDSDLVYGASVFAIPGLLCGLLMTPLAVGAYAAHDRGERRRAVWLVVSYVAVAVAIDGILIAWQYQTHLERTLH